MPYFVVDIVEGHKLTINGIFMGYLENSVKFHLKYLKAE